MDLTVRNHKCVRVRWIRLEFCANEVTIIQLNGFDMIPNNFDVIPNQCESDGETKTKLTEVRHNEFASSSVNIMPST